MRSIRAQMRSRRSRSFCSAFRTLAFPRSPPRASLSDLADHIGLMLPTVSKLVAGIGRSAAICKGKPTPATARRSALAPTAKGKRILTVALRSDP